MPPRLLAKGWAIRYEPAYRYGYELGTNERYRGRDWVALEADARRDWEAGIPTPGSASKTPSAMAGTKSAPAPRAAHHHAGSLSQSPASRVQEEGTTMSVRRRATSTDGHGAPPHTARLRQVAVICSLGIALLCAGWGPYGAAPFGGSAPACAGTERRRRQ